MIRNGYVRLLSLVFLCLLASVEVKGVTRNSSFVSSRPSFVNVGTLFTFNSTIGKVVKPAIIAAVDDVNSDSSILSGTKLNIIMHDTVCSEFLGTIEGTLTR